MSDKVTFGKRGLWCNGDTMVDDCYIFYKDIKIIKKDYGGGMWLTLDNGSRIELKLQDPKTRNDTYDSLTKILDGCTIAVFDGYEVFNWDEGNDC